MELTRTIAVVFAAALCLNSCSEAAKSNPKPAPAEPVRISMAALHQAGGVPPGWAFTPPLGDPVRGRHVFADYGCYSCHLVRGESFPDSPGDDAHQGPELTGMGSHHPPAYFAESILNPDAVLVEGTGYIGADGRSIMPSYPDMTLADLTDLVAYISSLTTGEPHPQGHYHRPPRIGDEQPPEDQKPLPPLPQPPGTPAHAFLARVFDIQEGHLGDFETWFAREGRKQLLAYPGVKSVETFVDRTCSGPALVTIFGFEDEPSIDHFLADPAAAPLHAGLAAFATRQDDYIFRSTPLYRVDALSGVDAASNP